MHELGGHEPVDDLDILRATELTDDFVLVGRRAVAKFVDFAEDLRVVLVVDGRPLQVRARLAGRACGPVLRATLARDVGAALLNVECVGLEADGRAVFAAWRRAPDGGDGTALHDGPPQDDGGAGGMPPAEATVGPPPTAAARPPPTAAPAAAARPPSPSDDDQPSDGDEWSDVGGLR